VNPRVYLAGPIKGLNYDEAVEWRTYATRVLKDEGIDAFSPMRAKTYLKGLTDVGGDKLKDSYDQFPLSTMKAILCRDRNDCQKAGVVIMYLRGAKAVSIGSVMEVAWADAARVPIVLVMEKEGNVHEHGLLTEACNVRVETLEEAIKVTVAILKP
jgi:nucleoside 2-deoxyribosyltransferase